MSRFDTDDLQTSGPCGPDRVEAIPGGGARRELSQPSETVGPEEPLDQNEPSVRWEPTIDHARRVHDYEWKRMHAARGTPQWPKRLRVMRAAAAEVRRLARLGR